MEVRECAAPECSILFEPNTHNQKYHDISCKREVEKITKLNTFTEDLEKVLGEAKTVNAEPKILLLDIETSPNLVYTWGLWNQNIGLNQIEETSKVLCFSAKWLGSSKRDVSFYSAQNSREVMVKAAWTLLDQADAVIHYNGTTFDIPHLNREFLESGLGPPSPYQNIDLYKASKKFKFQSRKLEHVSRQLGLEGKVQHEGFELWRGCLRGDEKAWKTMEKYNKRDVTLMEDLYEILLPWVSGLPNRRLYNAEAGCPRCGSKHIQRRGIVRTTISIFQQYQCQDCNGWFRETHRSVGSDYRDIAAC